MDFHPHAPSTQCAACPALARSTFAHLPPDELAKIDAIRTPQNFAAKQDLPFTDGPKGTHRYFYCIQSGYLRLNAADDTQTPRAVRICGPGDLIGYVSEDSTAKPSAISFEPVLACRFELSQFNALRRTSHRIAESLINMLCRIIAIKDDRIVSLEQRSVKSRVAALLLSLDTKFGRKVGDDHFIDLDVDRKTLSTLAGTVTETFSRAITELEDDKIIRREKRSFMLVAMDKLRHIAKGK
ncbi:MAG: Crp/Fnr family transcriptional regulator [Bdellovibrionales bacterium]|nr:Crp/Fnr family transcriptional regulator [Bdellovibrionales bacterium]